MALGLAERIASLPDDRKDVIVIRSMPFGDIIEDDTRKVHGHVSELPGYRPGKAFNPYDALSRLKRAGNAR